MEDSEVSFAAHLRLFVKIRLGFKTPSGRESKDSDREKPCSWWIEKEAPIVNVPSQMGNI